MPKRYIFQSTGRELFEMGDPAPELPEPWSNMEQNKPHAAEVPDELNDRYEKVVGEFWSVQAEMKKLHDATVPPGVVRPK